MVLFHLVLNGTFWYSKCVRIVSLSKLVSPRTFRAKSHSPHDRFESEPMSFESISNDVEFAVFPSKFDLPKLLTRLRFDYWVRHEVHRRLWIEAWGSRVN